MADLHQTRGAHKSNAAECVRTSACVRGAVQRDMSNARQPDAATLSREALYICQLDGFIAYRCTKVPTDDELALIGWARVEFKAVRLRPPVCPVNGAEFGDEPYWARVPHRPDGTRLKYG